MVLPGGCGDELAVDLPVRAARPVLDALEAGARRRIGMLDPQRIALATLDHGHHALAFVEAELARAGAVVVRIAARCRASRGCAVERQGHALLRHEAQAAVLESNHAQVRRTHRQADAVVGIAAEIVRAGSSQCRPIRLVQPSGWVRSAWRCVAPCLLLAAAKRLPWLRLPGDGLRRRRHAAGRPKCQQQQRARRRRESDCACQRPRRNQRSISGRVKRAQVGRP